MSSRILIPFILLLAAFNIDPLPKLFVAGDSISMQYGPYLEVYLQGIADYERKTDNAGVDPSLGVPVVNGGDSRMVLEYLKAKTEDPAFQPDYLLINCGLHDIKREVATSKLQVSADNYRKNLQAIIELAANRDIQPIWVRTTPVVDSIHNSRAKKFQRFSSDLETYNEIADQVMTENQVPVIDLYTFTWNLGLEQFMDHVHYHEEARKLQGAYIAGSLADLMSKN